MARLGALAQKRFQELGLTKKEAHKEAGLWHKAKVFFTSPAGVVTIIVLAILIHYAWKGHKAEAK